MSVLKKPNLLKSSVRRAMGLTRDRQVAKHNMRIFYTSSY